MFIKTFPWIFLYSFYSSKLVQHTDSICEVDLNNQLVRLSHTELEVHHTYPACCWSTFVFHIEVLTVLHLNINIEMFRSTQMTVDKIFYLRQLMWYRHWVTWQKCWTFIGYFIGSVTITECLLVSCCIIAHVI